MSIHQFSISYSDKERSTKVAAILKEYGVVVVTDVFTAEECDSFMSNIVKGIETISPQVSSESIETLQNTWNDRDLMPQVRKGLHQLGYSFLGWPVRGSAPVTKIFQEVYSVLREKPITETVTSLDAVNIRPPIPPFDNNGNDWAHVDQTMSNDPFLCVQGQVVLTTTTAGFRCSPKSHLAFPDIVAHCGKAGQKGNFLKYKPHEYQDIQNFVKRVGGEWQIPVIAPKGSMILWFSSTTHSAKLADPINLTTYDPEDKWKYWRGVVYCSQRPKEEVDGEHLRRLQYAAENNITTNHWGTKLFKGIPFGAKKTQFNPNISKYVSQPRLIFNIPGLKPTLSEAEMALLGK